MDSEATQKEGRGCVTPAVRRLPCAALLIVVIAGGCQQQSEKRLTELENRLRRAELQQAAMRDDIRGLRDRWKASEKDLADAANRSRSAAATVDAYLNTISLPSAQPQPDATPPRQLTSSYTSPSIQTPTTRREAAEPAPQPVQKIAVDSIARAKCSAEWSNDPRMLAFCEEQEMSAKASLTARTYTSTGMWPTQFQEMRASCQREWPNDYRMQDYCESQWVLADRKVVR